MGLASLIDVKNAMKLLEAFLRNPPKTFF